MLEFQESIQIMYMQDIILLFFFFFFFANVVVFVFENLVIALVVCSPLFHTHQVIT